MLISNLSSYFLQLKKRLKAFAEVFQIFYYISYLSWHEIWRTYFAAISIISD